MCSEELSSPVTTRMGAARPPLLLLSGRALRSLFLQDRERTVQLTEGGAEEAVRQKILPYWQIKTAFKGAQDDILGAQNYSIP